jgi:hypothetical protein
MIHMKREWFVYAENATEGPFTSAEVESRLNTYDFDDIKVWGRQSPRWMEPQAWRSWVASELNKIASQTNLEWKFRGPNHSESKLLSEEALAESLRDLDDYSQIEVWTKGLMHWEPIYNFHVLLDRLGVSRRKHPRIHTDGKVFLNGEESLVLPLSAISEGGFGVTRATSLKVGTHYDFEFESKHFPFKIKGKASCVYTSDSQVAGFKFDYISEEAKSLIIQYVLKELGQDQGSKAA